MQSRRHSFLEASCNTATGFVVSYVVSLIVYPMFGFTPSAGQNLVIVTIFTVTSVLRSYAWRRMFNWYHHRR